MQSSLRHTQKALQLNPRYPTYHVDLGGSCRVIARRLVQRGQLARAQQVCAGVVKFLDNLAAEFPDVPYYERISILTHLGDLLRDADSEKAQQAYRQAEAIRQQLKTNFTDLPVQYRNDLMPRIIVFVDYKVRITTAGDYRLYVRWDDYSSWLPYHRGPRLWAFVTELGDGPRGPVADWYTYNFDYPVGYSDADFATDPWVGSAESERPRDRHGRSACSSEPVPAVWSISALGEYTIRFEYGRAIDAFVFQLSSLPAPAGDGPEESKMIPGGIFLESDGRVVAEAENFTSRPPATGVVDYLVVPKRIRENLRTAISAAPAILMPCPNQARR